MLWKHPGFPEVVDRVLEILDGFVPPALCSSESSPIDEKRRYERMPGWKPDGKLPKGGFE